MSMIEREPDYPAGEAETPRDVWGLSSYAVTLAALAAALDEPLPLPLSADGVALSTLEG